MSFGIMGISSTDPKYKEFERKWNQEQKQKVKPATRSKGRFYSDLSEKEKRKVDSILNQYNQEQRQRFGISEKFAGVEFR